MPAKPSRSEPDPFDQMLSVVPAEIRANVERLLRGFGITNNDDPLVQIITALTLYAAYYQTIPGHIAKEGAIIKRQSDEAALAFEARTEYLRSIVIKLQGALDGLAAVPQDLAKRFPSEKIAEELKSQIIDKLSELPIGEIEKAFERINHNMGVFIKKSDQYVATNETRLAALQKQAETLKQVQSNAQSSSSFAGIVIALIFGMFFGMALGITFVWVTEVEPILRTESVVAKNTMAGEADQGPILYVAKSKIDAYAADPQGNLTIKFKTPTPSPEAH